MASLEVELLQAIADNTDSKDSFYIIVTAKSSSVVTTFSPPFILRQRSNGTSNEYEMALVGLNTYYSFPNVDKTCNSLTVLQRGSGNRLHLDTGCYEITAINREIWQSLWKTEKDAGVTFQANVSTLKCIMNIKPGYGVKFNVDNSLAPVLGFEKKEYSPGTHPSENPVDILKVNSILVYCDIITGSRVDGIEAPIIYHFSPNVAPGIKIVIEPQQPIYLPITVDTISRMEVWLTDQNKRPIDLRGEKVVLTFHVRAR